MSALSAHYELPKNVERYLAALSELYGHEGKRQLQELIVNAGIVVHEGWSTDSWNGGTYGHALFLTIPKPLFLSCVKQKDELSALIATDLNKLHSFKNECIAEVFIDLAAGDNLDWRKESGLQTMGKRITSPDAIKRIWDDDCFRLFLSHKTEVKKETAELKAQLRAFGFSCFVAHEDIQPTQAWQDEIENALASMDGFVALLTDNFHESYWTDQEVGYAFARGVPLISVRLGKDPYGFIGKFQALSCSWASAAEEIVRLLLKNDRAFSAYIKAIRACPNWDAGNVLGLALRGVAGLSAQQVDDLISAYNETDELRGSFAFNGSKSGQYGPGLIAHLNRQGARQFRRSPQRLIEDAP